MKLTSPAFKDNNQIPKKYTCDGDNINPPLEISEIPEGTKSLALIVDDPDAPGGDWVHWLAWNIPPNTTEIHENKTPDEADGSIEGTTDFGRPGWGGPCPPSGTHRYQFKLYALDNELTLEPEAQKKGLENAMDSHILEKAILTGVYKRQ